MENIDTLLKNFYRVPETPKSYFLSFEGIEGSGKSTQIKLIENILSQKGFKVLCLREPGGTTFGEELRAAILKNQSPLHPLAECHLFLASRVQLLYEKILPFLQTPNSIVILDRYIDSTLAYQGTARGLGLEMILDLHKHYPLNLLPHRTYFLDINLETSLNRQEKRGGKKDYFESQANEFHHKLIEGYRLAAQHFQDRVIKIDASDTPEKVSAIIAGDLEKILA